MIDNEVYRNGAEYMGVNYFGTWAKKQRYSQLKTGPEPVRKSVL